MAIKTFKGILGVHDDISELRYVEDSKKYLDCLTLRYFYPGCITCNCGIVKKDVDTFIEMHFFFNNFKLLERVVLLSRKIVLSRL